MLADSSGVISGQAVFEAEVLRTLCKNGCVRTCDDVSEFTTRRTQEIVSSVSYEKGAIFRADDAGSILPTSTTSKLFLP
jgi:hypothetical protein